LALAASAFWISFSASASVFSAGANPRQGAPHAWDRGQGAGGAKRAFFDNWLLGALRCLFFCLFGARALHRHRGGSVARHLIGGRSGAAPV
jgi:hypothetical protein